jgi:hypothetical protein
LPQFVFQSCYLFLAFPGSRRMVSCFP